LEYLVIRVMIVEEMGLLRGALSAVLAHEKDITVVAELGDAVEICDIAQTQQPDVIVIDIDLTGFDTLKLVPKLYAQLPRCAVLVLTARRTPGALRRALQAGVRGFLTKEVGPVQLIRMIHQVYEGSQVIDPVVALAALNAAKNPLTGREQDVLRAMAQGLSTKETAELLFLSYGTVRNHLSAILRKTGTYRRGEAIRRAQDAGWL
jgi:two-component system response regulator DesR